ncbi:polysaccharide deacetylase family protein [Ruegeria arenilitoris]|uniref:polysaccharide deacetylase family protein n=1 Tax=Ruegeria arenilitoris TaxID=1173585 RepID=UPI00147CA6BA|nr:polysaccharide deacetylase family protein [Ruegeria arenilitoris]
MERMESVESFSKVGPENVAWESLRNELNNWAKQGKKASFWWRDDDATTTGPQLSRLLALSENYEAPIGLAVIPAYADSQLAEAVHLNEYAYVLQHGYAHTNHASGMNVQGAWELGLQRPLGVVLAELEKGKSLLRGLFQEDRFVPVAVPPWNRIDPLIVEHLAGLGFVGLSTGEARHAMEAAPGLNLVNVHCDPIKWKGGAHFTGTEKSISFLTDHLSARRKGLVDSEEPTGFITHHAVHDDAIWDFSEKLLSVLHEHSAAYFVSPKEAFLP